MQVSDVSIQQKTTLYTKIVFGCFFVSKIYFSYLLSQYCYQFWLSAPAAFNSVAFVPSY